MCVAGPNKVSIKWASANRRSTVIFKRLEVRRLDLPKEECHSVVRPQGRSDSCFLEIRESVTKVFSAPESACNLRHHPDIRNF